MKLYNEDEELFYKKIRSLKEKAIINNQVSLIKFLDIRHQDIIKYVIGNDLFLYFDGGYNDSEYKKCIISPFELSNPNFKIDILELKYNSKYLTLNHRKVMATLLDLGIKREVFGDIAFENGRCYICVSNEMTDYIVSNLRVISHTPVSLEIVHDTISNIIDLEIKKVYVSSLRIDAVISHMYNISRNISQDYVRNELVKVNQTIISNTSHIIKENDILSVRGKGRFKVLSILGKTKNDKIILQLGKYL